MTPGFWWILLSLVLYGALHSLLASRLVKQAVASRLGPQGSRYYRLFFSIQGGLTFLPSLALLVLLPDRAIYRIPAPWQYLAYGLQLAGVVIVIYGVLQTGAMRFLGLDALLDPQSGQRKPVLVTNGLYRWMRHPLYTGTLFFLWLGPTLTWNGLAFNLGVMAYFIIGSHFEEEKLMDEFGRAYADYRRRTPAFLPRLRHPG